jgi:hypothetical protein
MSTDPHISKRHVISNISCYVSTEENDCILEQLDLQNLVKAVVDMVPRRIDLV